MQPRAMGRRGRLYSFTIAHVAAVGFEAPYFQAFVDLPEGPRVFALISHDVPVRPDALQEGMELELVIEPVIAHMENSPTLTYKYRPTRRSGGQ